METLNAFLLSTPDLVEEQREILLEAVDRLTEALDQIRELFGG